MTYEEKRELRLQISQLLADAGLNQATIKEMVNNEIKNKVDRAIEQTLNNLNATTSGGNYIGQQVSKKIDIDTRYNLRSVVADILKDRILKVTFDNSVIN